MEELNMKKNLNIHASRIKALCFLLSVVLANVACATFAPQSLAVSKENTANMAEMREEYNSKVKYLHYDEVSCTLKLLKSVSHLFRRPFGLYIYICPVLPSKTSKFSNALPVPNATQETVS